MKTFLKKIVVLFVLIFSLANLGLAKEAALIVKQDGLTVFLDTSEFKNKPKIDDKFRIVEYGEELKNPNTGKSLGRQITKQTTGRITQVEDLYSVGKLDSNNNVLNQEAEVEVSAATPVIANTAISTQVPLGSTQNILPIWQSKEIEGKAKASALGDINGDGKSDLILAFEEDNAIKVYSLENNALKEILNLKVNALRKIISLDAADLKQTGKDQIFATVYDSSSQRFNTFVFEDENNLLKQTDTVKGMVKGNAPYNGKRVLYTQDINLSPDGKIIPTTPAELIYKDGKFKTGDKVKTYRLDSIFGLTFGDFKNNGKLNPVFISAKKIRIQFDKKNSYVNSPDEYDFSSTPNRIKLKNDVHRIYLSVALFKNTDNETIIAGVENQTKLGILSDTFGSYNGAKLVFLKWTGNSLVNYGASEIGGPLYDITQGSLGDYKNIIVAPFAATSGYTTVLLYWAK
ncbi:MAG: VCBS repeat-containing protein [Elusimicrobiota bacterium]|jgi:hypothetical protein|nr:VCBS repeat-containing protein [Elusimicrobiota bacterium]